MRGGEESDSSERGDDVMNDDLIALLKSVRKLAMRESLIKDGQNWSLHANRKSKRQQRQQEIKQSENNRLQEITTPDKSSQDRSAKQRGKVAHTAQPGKPWTK